MFVILFDYKSNLRDAPKMISEIVVAAVLVYNAGLIFGTPTILQGWAKITVCPWRVELNLFL